MSTKNKIIFLWIATAIIVVAYLFWEAIFIATGGNLKHYNETGETGMGIDVFFPLQALFMCMLCWIVNSLLKYTVTFILFWLSLGNLIDELLFNNQSANNIEYAYAICVFVAGMFIHIRKLRENRK